MGGRFGCKEEIEALRAKYGAFEGDDLAGSRLPRFNIAPTQLSPVFFLKPEGGYAIKSFRWGLVPFWAKDLKISNQTFNARAETVAEKPAHSRVRG